MTNIAWREFALAVASVDSPFKIMHENYRTIVKGRGYFDYKNPDDHFSLSGFISPSNARLIAAAPEALEALEAILDSATDGRTVPEWLAERLVSAEAAIKKARGQQ